MSGQGGEKTAADHLGMALGDGLLAALMVWAATRTDGALSVILWVVAVFRVLSAGVRIEKAARS